jgi:hypothetical protein
MVKPFDTVPEVTLMEAHATAQNVFVVRDGLARTPPLSAVPDMTAAALRVTRDGS